MNMFEKLVKINCYSKNKILRKAATNLLEKLYCCEINCTEIDKSVLFAHHACGCTIVASKICENVVIFQNVSIGSNMKFNKPSGEWENVGNPIISKNVVIADGAKILGPVLIGENSVVGAGAIITKDVPANNIAYGVNQFKPKDANYDLVYSSNMINSDKIIEANNQLIAKYMKTIYHVNVEEMNFAQLFKEISPEEIPDDVFTLTGKIYPVITAGKGEHYNSMTASGGGMGLLFRKPAIWCVLQSTRYTLELIQKEQSYTLSYFPHEYKKQVHFLGSKSGRDSEKMKEVELTSVQTPSGNISFKEARLIIECKLAQITTPNPDDFCTQEARDYISEVYKDPNEYRKYVFGEITHVWMKNSLLH